LANRHPVLEKLLSKDKARWRIRQARAPADLVKAMGQALARVTARDAKGWFNWCGDGFF
jgi:hypothetical protein